MAIRVAVASGKGGTGKTSLAVSLALALLEDGEQQADPGPPPLFLDCDVEAPDAHLFLHPEMDSSKDVALQIPVVDRGRCSLHGECVDVCQYNALAILGGEVRIFPELCHGCGSCTLICPEEAIYEVPRVLGHLEAGWSGGIRFAHGILNVGEAMAVPVIHDLKQWATPQADQVTILDAPPGTSCPMVETVAGSDFVLLVTEPTPFGLHDLKLAVEAIGELGIPMGVIINRDGIGDRGVDEFCTAEGLPVLLRVPFQREIAEEIAKGGTILGVRPEYGEVLRQMIRQITATAPQPESGEPTSAGDGMSEGQVES